MRPAIARQRGFTLAETLMAMAVATVALTMAGPGLEALTRGTDTAASVNELVSTMHLARSTAVTRNVRVTVCASRDGETCAGSWQQGWISFIDDDADQSRSDMEPLLARFAGLDALALHSEQFPEAFSYRANGRVAGADPTATTGEFSFCAPDEERAVRVVIVRASGLPILSGTGLDGAMVDCPAS